MKHRINTSEVNINIPIEMLRTCLQSCRLGEFLGAVAAPVYLRRHIQVLQKQGVETWTARGHKSGRGSAAAGSP